jgi:hypothetical protein
MPARLLLRNQRRELERFSEAYPADLSRARLRNREVPPLQRASEDRSRVALRRQRRLSGAGRRYGS